MTDYLLSICIPTYNRAQIVYECVKNCLKIDSDAIEVVVNDNCSSDETKNLLATIQDKRFSYYSNSNNIGYQNLAVVLSKCKGKFALLMSDEDEVFNVDWNAVLKQLEENNSTAVFQCEYFDEEEKRLVQGPEKVFEKDDAETYCFVLRRCLYAGALIVKKSILDSVWNRIDKQSFMWSTYPQCVLPLYCIKYGDFRKLEGLYVRRTERNNKGTIASINKGEEPYWSVGARLIQNEEWINLIFSMRLEEEKINKIFMEILIVNARQMVKYHGKLSSGNWKESPTFSSRRDIIERDLKVSKATWIRLFFKNKRILFLKEKELLERNGMTYHKDKSYRKRMWKEYQTLIIQLISRI